MLVRVTNRNNAWNVRDKYAGIEYRFPAGDTVTVPAEAAEHIFGYGLDERGRRQKFLRMGIANLKDGERMWANIVIKPAGNVAPTGAVRDAA
jgi:hypothetical protein